MDEKNSRSPGGAAEAMAEATRRTYSAAVDQAFDIQKSNVELSRTFFEGWLEMLEQGARLNRRALGDVTGVVREQQRVLRDLSRVPLDAYDGFLGSLPAYEKEVFGGARTPGGDLRR